MCFGNYIIIALACLTFIVVVFVGGVAVVAAAVAVVIMVFNGTLNSLFFARFCKTLFLPEFLSN